MRETSRKKRVIYLTIVMNKLRRLIVILALGWLMALFGTVLTYPVALQSSAFGASAQQALFFQVTPTSQPLDQSEIGSTDGIVAMGGVIAVIILIPILLRRKYWMRLSPPA